MHEESHDRSFSIQYCTRTIKWSRIFFIIPSMCEYQLETNIFLHTLQFIFDASVRQHTYVSFFMKDYIDTFQYNQIVLKDPLLLFILHRDYIVLSTPRAVMNFYLGWEHNHYLHWYDDNRNWCHQWYRKWCHQW